MRTMAKINYEGCQYTYDEKALKSYSVIKGFSTYETDPAAAFASFGKLFQGRDEEYAEKLGGGLEGMLGLVGAIMKKAGEATKN